MKKLSLITLLSVGAILTTACSQATNQQTQKAETTTTTQQATEKKVVEEVKPNYDLTLTLKSPSEIEVVKGGGSGAMSLDLMVFPTEKSRKSQTIPVHSQEKTFLSKFDGLTGEEQTIVIGFDNNGTAASIAQSIHQLTNQPVFVKLKVGESVKLSDIKFEKNKFTEPVKFLPKEMEKYEIKDGLAK